MLQRIRVAFDLVDLTPALERIELQALGGFRFHSEEYPDSGPCPLLSSQSLSCDWPRSGGHHRPENSEGESHFLARWFGPSDKRREPRCLLPWRPHPCARAETLGPPR